MNIFYYNIYSFFPFQWEGLYDTSTRLDLYSSEYSSLYSFNLVIEIRFIFCMLAIEELGQIDIYNPSQRAWGHSIHYNTTGTTAKYIRCTSTTPTNDTSLGTRIFVICT